MWATLLPLLLAASVASAATPPKKRPVRRASAATSLRCGNVLAFQILLDRHSFSPGQIDGQTGPNLSRAVTALQAARKLPATGRLDCDTWRALGGDRAGELLAPYTLTGDDVDGPYMEDVPADLGEQANLPGLNYGSMLERLGERFHASPALIRQLNARVALTPAPRSRFRR